MRSRGCFGSFALQSTGALVRALPQRPQNRMSVPSHSDIFAVGDTAAVTDQPGIPGTAPPAKQMGRYVGRLIAARVAGTPSPPPWAE
jgi:NADH dehydrogenase FAD-containing subunit